jgi:putative Holliday junction resolvase
MNKTGFFGIRASKAYYQLSKLVVQQIETTNGGESQQILSLPESGRIVSLDPGTKRLGVAVCDELRIATRPLEIIERSSWKKLLLAVKATISDFDAVALVIGLPLNSDGSESEMSREARELARKFGLSLDIPVFFQDERVTTYEARRRVWQNKRAEISEFVDSEAACIILEDFLDRMRSLRAKNG